MNNSKNPLKTSVSSDVPKTNLKTSISSDGFNPLKTSNSEPSYNTLKSSKEDFGGSISPSTSTSSFTAISATSSLDGGNNNVSWKEGNLYKREKGIIRSSWKEKFVILLEGSLFYYNQHTDLTPKGVIHLSKCKVSEGNEKKHKRKNLISIFTGSNDEVIFSAESSSQKSLWIEAINSALTKKPSPPPDKEFIKKSKPTTVYMSGRLIDSITNMGASGKLAKEFITEDGEVIMDCVKNFMTKYHGAEKTSKWEKQMTSIVIKVAVLYKDKHVTKEYFQSVIVPLRLMISKIIDGYEIPFTFSPTELIENIRSVQSAFEQIFRPFLHDKTMNKMKDLFDMICNEEMIEDLFEKKKYKECEILGLTLRKMWDNGMF